MAQANNPCVPSAVLLLMLLAGGLNSVFAAGNEDVAALTAGIIDSALGFLPADKAENHKQQSEIDALRAALNATVAKEGPTGPSGPPGINGTNAPVCPTVIGSSQINQCCAGNDQCFGVTLLSSPVVGVCRPTSNVTATAVCRDVSGVCRQVDAPECIMADKSCTPAVIPPNIVTPCQRTGSTRQDMGRCGGTGHCFYFYAGIPGVIASVDIADFVVAPDSITSLTACLQLCDDTVGCEVALFTDSRPASGLPAREAACRLQKTVTSTVLPATPTLLNTTNQVSYAYVNDQVFITAAIPPAFLYPGAKYFSPGSTVVPGPTNATACATACRALRPAPRFCTFDSTGAGTCARYSTAPTIYSASASFTSIFFNSANS